MKIIISETSRSTIWAGPKTGEVWIARESRSRLPLGNLHVSMKINNALQIYLLKLKTSRSQLYQKLRTRAKHHFSQNRVIRKKTTLKLCLPVETHRKMRMRKNGAPPAAPPQLLQLSSYSFHIEFNKEKERKR